MSSFVYNVAKEALLEGTLDVLNDTIRCLALTAASDENKDDDTVSAVLARAGTTEVTGGSYSRQTLGSKTATADDTDDEGVFDAGDITFSGVPVGQDIVALLLYKFTTDDTGSVPIAFLDDLTGLPLTADGGNVTVTWAAEGIININDA